MKSLTGEKKRTSTVVKLPKKGNLRECTNWRGITLLPVVSKIFGRVFISRIKERS